jgi:hypothetical protein
MELVTQGCELEYDDLGLRAVWQYRDANGEIAAAAMDVLGLIDYFTRVELLHLHPYEDKSLNIHAIENLT